MTQQEIKDEIARLQADNAAIGLKVSAVGVVGSIAGVYIAGKQGKRFWGKAGYFIAGGLIARTPMVLLYAGKLADNLARIQQLENQLTI